jgi:hypothetical protein
MPFFILSPLNDFSFNKNGFERFVQEGCDQGPREFTSGWNIFDQLPDAMSNMPNAAFNLVKVGSSKGLVKISAS